MSNPKLTVAIIGGGIGGLSFAVALLKARNDVVIDIYEAGETFSELGAGLNLWPRVLEVLHSFGLEDELYKYAGPPGLYKKMKFMKADQPEGIYWGEAPANMHGIHRADFLKVFVNHTTTGCTSHFSKKLLSYEDAAGRPVTLKFADGTTATCDLLVGADGVKSAVRSNMYSQIADEMEKAGRPSDVVQSMKNCMKPIWAGSIIYRQLIPREVLEKAFPDHVALDNPTFFQGKSKFLITYPISKGRWVNCAAIVARHDQYGSTYEGSWAVRVTNDVLAEEYANWDPAATTLIHLMDSPIRWVMNTVEYLPTYASGRVAILGDAAHAMTTYQAAGAMQAVEDGFVLAALLAEDGTNRDTVSLALKTYDEVRRPIGQHFMRLSLWTGQTLLCEKMDGVTAEMSAAGLIPREQILKQADQLDDLYKWSWETSALPDRDRALEMYRSRLQGLYDSGATAARM